MTLHTIALSTPSPMSSSTTTSNSLNLEVSNISKWYYHIVPVLEPWHHYGQAMALLYHKECYSCPRNRCAWIDYLNDCTSRAPHAKWLKSGNNLLLPPVPSFCILEWYDHFKSELIFSQPCCEYPYKLPHCRRKIESSSKMQMKKICHPFMPCLTKMLLAKIVCIKLECTKGFKVKVLLWIQPLCNNLETANYAIPVSFNTWIHLSFWHTANFTLKFLTNFLAAVLDKLMSPSFFPSLSISTC